MFLTTCLLAIMLNLPTPITKTVQPEPELYLVEASAYCNPNGNKTANGSETIDGLTLAAKKEWLGYTAALYFCNEDGSVGELIGYREITDTGYGRDSTLYPGKGTIQTGECVDIYMESRDDCIKWGRRKIYIQLIWAEG